MMLNRSYDVFFEKAIYYAFSNDSLLCNRNKTYVTERLETFYENSFYWQWIGHQGRQLKPG